MSAKPVFSSFTTSSGILASFPSSPRALRLVRMLSVLGRGITNCSLMVINQSRKLPYHVLDSCRDQNLCSIQPRDGGAKSTNLGQKVPLAKVNPPFPLGPYIQTF